MNPDFPKDERAALESSLTALLLGELPHDQAADLHQKLSQDVELAKLYERLKQTINLVRETIASPVTETADQPTPLKLSDERRQKLLQKFKTVRPKEFVPPRRRAMVWLVPVGIAAAVVALLSATLLPKFANRSQLASSLGTEVYVPMAKLAADTTLERSRSASLLQVQRNPQFRHLGVENRNEAPPTAAPAEPAPVPVKPTASAIVLPKASEVADGTPTTTTAGAKAWFETANLRGFYDDSLSRAGDQGDGGSSGGRAGGSGGEAKGDTSVAGGQQAGNVAAGAHFTQSAEKNVLEWGRPVVEGKPIQAFGEPPPPAQATPGTLGEVAATELNSSKGRKETIGFYDLQNAEPQDVYNNLQDLFRRNNVRSQNNQQDAVVGQNKPVTEHLRNNTEGLLAATGSRSGGGGLGGSGGETRGKLLSIEGRQQEVAAVNGAIGEPEWLGKLEAGTMEVNRLYLSNLGQFDETGGALTVGKMYISSGAKFTQTGGDLYFTDANCSYVGY
ncbi:MAG: hypothetical protein NT154_13120, partial [Verrucomicrobia bacterium]|nr:hypothetical protein [Verrucomicrobiota bacterium]